MLIHVPRARAVAVLAAAALLVTGCGSERTTGTVVEKPQLNLPAAQPQGSRSSVGLLVSADQSSITIKSRTGFETFIIRSEDRARLGLEHLLSHAGSAVGFEVFYEAGDEPDINFAVGARETAPPAGVTLE